MIACIGCLLRELLGGMSFDDEDAPRVLLVGVPDPKMVIGLAVAKYLGGCGGETTLDRIVDNIGPRREDLSSDKSFERLSKMARDVATGFVEAAERDGMLVTLGPKIVLTAKGREGFTQKEAKLG